LSKGGAGIGGKSAVSCGAAKPLIVLAIEGVAGGFVKPPDAKTVESLLIHLKRGSDQVLARELFNGELDGLGRTPEARIATQSLSTLLVNSSAGAV
jgi:hypothetical protein